MNPPARGARLHIIDSERGERATSIVLLLLFAAALTLAFAKPGIEAQLTSPLPLSGEFQKYFSVATTGARDGRLSAEVEVDSTSENETVRVGATYSGGSNAQLTLEFPFQSNEVWDCRGEEKKEEGIGYFTLTTGSKYIRDAYGSGISCAISAGQFWKEESFQRRFSSPGVYSMQPQAGVKSELVIRMQHPSSVQLATANISPAWNDSTDTTFVIPNLVAEPPRFPVHRTEPMAASPTSIAGIVAIFEDVDIKKGRDLLILQSGIALGVVSGVVAWCIPEAVGLGFYGRRSRRAVRRPECPDQQQTLKDSGRPIAPPRRRFRRGFGALLLASLIVMISRSKKPRA